MVAILVISWSLAAIAGSLMLGVIEWGLIPITLTRETLIRTGYPNGEGPLSKNYEGGVIVDPKGDHLGMYLAMLSQHFTEYEWMRGTIFFMKRGEAREVFDLVKSMATGRSCLGYWRWS